MHDELYDDHERPEGIEQKGNREVRSAEAIVDDRCCSLPVDVHDARGYTGDVGQRVAVGLQRT